MIGIIILYLIFGFIGGLIGGYIAQQQDKLK